MNDEYSCCKCYKKYPEKDMNWRDKKGKITKSQWQYAWCVDCVPQQKKVGA